MQHYIMQKRRECERNEVEDARHQMAATHVRDTIYALLMSLQLRDAYSGQHSIAVLWLVDHFAQILGLHDEDRLLLKRAARIRLQLRPPDG